LLGKGPAAAEQTCRTGQRHGRQKVATIVEPLHVTSSGRVESAILARRNSSIGLLPKPWHVRIIWQDIELASVSQRAIRPLSSGASDLCLPLSAIGRPSSVAESVISSS